MGFPVTVQKPVPQNTPNFLVYFVVFFRVIVYNSIIVG